MKSKLLSILAVAIMLLSVLALSACDLLPVEPPKGEDEAYRAIYRLYVDNAKNNGETPRDYEEWLNEIRGEDGKDGKDGVTPRLRINQESGEWEISTDNGKTWKSLGFSAVGVKGDKGDDGITPKLRITDGWWEVSYDNGVTWESLGVKATGEKGDKGEPGEKGDKGDKGEPGDPGTGSACQHNLSDWIVISEPSCENIGISYRSCSECGYVEHNFTEKTAHNFVTFISIFEKKCSDCYHLQYCTKCNATRTEAVGDNHLVVITDEAVEPTCTESGLTEGSHCDYCGEIIMAQTIIPALGHTVIIDEAVEPTCTERGLTEGSHCDVCGEILVKQETLSKIPHNMVDGVCTVCGCDYEIYDITIWVDNEDMKTHIAQQIEDFMSENPDLILNYTIECMSVYTISNYDATTIADLFLFDSQAIKPLLSKGMLSPLNEVDAEFVTSNNSICTVKMVTHNDTIYAYPMAEWNGYYMYYDTSIITNPESLEDIIAACEANGKTFRYALENAWYTASFFFATGCVSEWTMDENGKFTSVNDTFNSPEGLIAMKGMQKLVQSPCYDSDNNIFTDVGAIIAGTWYRGQAEEYFRENLGVAKLPFFTVDGTKYQLGSYAQGVLLGTKPQSDEQKQYALSRLAKYLSGEKCQLENCASTNMDINSFPYIPSNTTVQQMDLVQSNSSMAALIEQNNYALPQGIIYGGWWDIAGVLGRDAQNAETDADLQAALDEYTVRINTVLPRTEEEKNAWSVIGDICGTMWDIDFPMTKIDETTWISNPLELNVGEQFKVRQGGSWDLYFGSDGTNGGVNFYVEVSGMYRVKLVWNGGDTAEVSLIPAE